MSGSLSVMQSLCVAQCRDTEHGGILQSSGDAECVRPAHRTWLVMPFMHSEQLADQQVMPRWVRRHVVYAGLCMSAASDLQ